MPARSPHSYDPTLPTTGGGMSISGTTDIPARLNGGNAQTVEVRGLDYTLHLDLAKLPVIAGGGAAGKWTVVWDEIAGLYRRAEFSSLPSSGIAEAPLTGGPFARKGGTWVPLATISTEDPSGGADGDVWYQVT